MIHILTPSNIQDHASVFSNRYPNYQDSPSEKQEVFDHYSGKTGKVTCFVLEQNGESVAYCSVSNDENLSSVSIDAKPSVASDTYVRFFREAKKMAREIATSSIVKEVA
jgi:hypothetical protein